VDDEKYVWWEQTSLLIHVFPRSCYNPPKQDLKIDSNQKLNFGNFADTPNAKNGLLPQMLIQVSNLGSTVKLSLGGIVDL
jgi:hypothetical protein